MPAGIFYLILYFFLSSRAQELAERAGSGRSRSFGRWWWGGICGLDAEGGGDVREGGLGSAESQEEDEPEDKTGASPAETQKSSNEGHRGKSNWIEKPPVVATRLTGSPA